MNSSESDGRSLQRDKEMKVSEGGYREMESGLDASFLWSHDKSERDGDTGGEVKKRRK